MDRPEITVETLIDAPVEAVWGAYNSPEAIRGWNFASDDWCCPRAEVDLRPGGQLRSRMEARDGSMGFDFVGTYEEVVPQEALAVRLEDGRRYRTTFAQVGEGTRVTTRFEPDAQHPADVQRAGWQAILGSFKAHVEGRRR